LNSGYLNTKHSIMAHDHQHDHGPEGANARRLAITLALVLVYMGVEVVGGLLADSLR